MKAAVLSLAIAALIAAAAGRANAQTPLVLEAKIPLGDVRGRIDHMAVDLSRRRLFVAELENDAVGVVDLDAGKVMQVITDAKAPQGVGYLPSTDTLYVANGGDAVLRMFAGDGYRPLEPIALGEDADNVRIDAAAKEILVGYGNGALAIVDAASRKKVADIQLASHPESFQLDGSTGRIFVNEPKQQGIAVIDRGARKPVATWKIDNASNFPMALNEASGHVLVVYRSPPKLVAFAAATGAQAASLDTCGDADDMFVDAKRSRVYVTCGEGFVDVFEVQGGQYRRIAHTATIAGARASLFV